MKVRYLKPGEKGPDLSFPVVYETNHSVYIQIEHEGQSYTFSLRQEDDGLAVFASDAPMTISPKMGNMIVVRGPKDDDNQA